eukprot:1647136-Pleurochrysis_carterae.AAC.1
MHTHAGHARSHAHADGVRQSRKARPSSSSTTRAWCVRDVRAPARDVDGCVRSDPRVRAYDKEAKAGADACIGDGECAREIHVMLEKEADNKRNDGDGGVYRRRGEEHRRTTKGILS